MVCDQSGAECDQGEPFEVGPFGHSGESGAYLQALLDKVRVDVLLSFDNGVVIEYRCDLN